MKSLFVKKNRMFPKKIKYMAIEEITLIFCIMSVTSNTSTEELKPYCVDEYTIEKRILDHFKDKRWQLTKYHHVLRVRFLIDRR